MSHPSTAFTLTDLARPAAIFSHQSAVGSPTSELLQSCMNKLLLSCGVLGPKTQAGKGSHHDGRRRRIAEQHAPLDPGLALLALRR